MSAANRSTALVGRNRAAGPGAVRSARPRPGRRGTTPKPKLPGTGELAPAGSDFATRLNRSQRALRGRLEQRDMLVEVIRGVNATLEPAQIAEFIVDRVSILIPAPSWALLSLDEAEQLSVLAERALRPDMVRAVHDIGDWVMQQGREFASADLRRDPQMAQESVGAVMALPLSCRGRSVGALIALDRVASANEPRLNSAVGAAFRVLLEPAATALDSALQLKRAEALSVTDDLTHLYNLRYLNQVLRREAKRSARSGRPLSLLFIDLDGFKSVNDAHGHLCGSRALVEAAEVIRGSARETDMVARYGGDEFALVLPDTGRTGAWAVGERIRERLAAHRFLVDHGLDVHLTASVGIATLPDVADAPEELMRRADAAMYLVKDRGKNGIHAATAPADK